MYLNFDLQLAQLRGECLTLTWDVFKLVVVRQVFYYYFSLTLTWDVFKCNYFVNKNIWVIVFNFNMRCI